MVAFHAGSDIFKRALTAERCRRSLHAFIRHGWRHIDPMPYVDNWHVGALSEHLEAVTSGQINRLLINVPPGFAKSVVVAVMWPAWEWANEPGRQSLFGSYDEKLALRDSGKCRTLVATKWYQETFDPQFTFDKHQNAIGFYRNSVGGHRYSFGMGSGGKTGWRADKVVLDDPNSVTDRYNPRVLAGAYTVFKDVLTSRINNPLRYAFVAIQQRMATGDFTGKAIAEDEEYIRKCKEQHEEIMENNLWVHLKIPMIATDRPCRTRIGWQDPRGPGELLFPERYPPDAVEYMRVKSMGEDNFAGQCQQEPNPEGGARFNKTRFQHWFMEAAGTITLRRRSGVRRVVRLADCWSFVSVDLAVSEEMRADWTVFSTWGVTPDFDMFFYDRIRARMEEPEVIRTACDLYEKGFYHNIKPACFVVEENGLGKPIVQAMLARGLPVLGVHIHRTDKFARSATAAIRVEAGQVFFPDPATPWYSDPKDGFLVEIVNFPGHDHDDQVDTLSLAAEGLYEAGISGLTDRDTLPKRTQDAVAAMERRNNPQARSIAKRFFGGR